MYSVIVGLIWIGAESRNRKQKIIHSVLVGINIQFFVGVKA